MTAGQRENYCHRIKAKDIAIDGFVLTEHRQYDDESDYSDLARLTGITIFKGSEVETEYGHVLVFGVTRPSKKSSIFQISI